MQCRHRNVSILKIQCSITIMYHLVKSFDAFLLKFVSFLEGEGYFPPYKFLNPKFLQFWSIYLSISQLLKQLILSNNQSSITSNRIFVPVKSYSDKSLFVSFIKTLAMVSENAFLTFSPVFADTSYLSACFSS